MAGAVSPLEVIHLHAYKQECFCVAIVIYNVEK